MDAQLADTKHQRQAAGLLEAHFRQVGQPQPRIGDHRQRLARPKRDAGDLRLGGAPTPARLSSPFLILSCSIVFELSLLAANELVAGTVAGQPIQMDEIKGIQFSGKALLLEGQAEDEALSVYRKRFPFAQAFSSPVWAVEIDYVKLTDNSHGFGHKLSWSA